MRDQNKEIADLLRLDALGAWMEKGGERACQFDRRLARLEAHLGLPALVTTSDADQKLPPAAPDQVVV